MHLSGFQYLGTTVRRQRANGLGLSLTVYPEGQRQPWHDHENLTVFLLLRGSFIDESREHGEKVLDRTMMVVHPARASHAGVASPVGRAGLNIEPSKDWLDSFGFKSVDLTKYRFLDSPALTVKALRLALVTAEQDPVVEGALQDEVCDLLVGLSGSDAPAGAESNKWFRRLTTYVADSDLTACNLRSAASAMNVHPVYLARRFRERFGCTLGQMVLHRRLVCAAEDVLRRDRSLGSAAYEAGFSDQAHLSRLFRREVGLRSRAVLGLREQLATKV